MERHQSDEMRGVAWLCEASPSRLPGFSMPASPTPPVPRPPPPPPGGGGGGGSRGDTRGGPYPGEETHAPARSSGPPHTLDRGRYTPVGVGRRGGGMRPYALTYPVAGSDPGGSLPRPKKKKIYRFRGIRTRPGAGAPVTIIPTKVEARDAEGSPVSPEPILGSSVPQTAI